ncbi:hypothetical protein [Nitrospira lenta]|uniref:DUF2059 domain-containing protein n=1 Tax=Nitrospira lenta TaxID=1436998 RepID=A0A330L6Y8_9BACT|nr:hypothetical protein [Nitrospira lenta]SPP65667.1 exported hypothetical protein [Nitrospira lenta]
MLIHFRTHLAVWGVLALLAFPCSAQVGTGEAAKILNNMPPDLFAKVQALAQQLQQSIKEGKLSEAEVQQGMMSGHLAEKLKGLNPQAGQLLNEISDAMKNGQGPGETALMPLLGGLGISPN